MELRPYQQEASTSIFLDLLTGGTSLATMATGTGKTVVISDVVKTFLQMGERVLVLAHREEIISQTVRKISDYCDLDFTEIAVEMGKSSASHFSRVVVASVQTMKGSRLKTWPEDHFGLIVIDEAHHAPASTYTSIINYFNAKVLGLTATPERTDKKQLGGIFKSLSYDYPIQTGIEEGYLVPLKAKMVVVDGLDLKRVKINSKQGDFNEKSLEEEMLKKQNIWGVAKPILDLTEDAKCIIFTVSVFHSEAIAEILNSIRPNSAVSVSGSDTDNHRKKALEDFRSGNVKYLVNCQVFTEGVDIPEINCVVIARPTKSKSLYMQMIGRGLRLSEGKTSCLIVDFTDNCENISLVSVFDIFDTGDVEEEVKKVANKLATEESEKSVEELLVKARIIIEEKEKARQKREVKYSVKQVNPFEVLGVYSRPSIMDTPLSERQEMLLKQMGVPTVVNGVEISKKEAGRIIGKVMDRRRKGLASYKMIVLLKKYGISAENMKFEDALKLCKSISNNNWKLPEELKPLAAS